MATAVLMPRQGQSVETCHILGWKKKAGDAVAQGEMLCEVETDKATFEIEAPAAGTLLEIFFPEGEDVPVLVNIAAIGQPGEKADGLKPDAAAIASAQAAAQAAAKAAEGGGAPPAPPAPAASPAPAPAAAPAAPATPPPPPAGPVSASPRARHTAAAKGVDLAACAGSGPHGRVVERDVLQAAAAGPTLTPAARAAAAGGATVPAAGTGIGGRVTTADLAAAKAVPAAAPAAAPAAPGAVTKIPVKGIRKLIAERMFQSLQTTAQLTMHTGADATALLAYRQRLKASPEDLGVSKITITDMVLYAVARTLPRFPELNALFEKDTITQFADVHLAMAVDTPRGLMVPVIRQANRLTLKQISAAAKVLAKGCVAGGVNPDDLQGGTITVSNLGAFGVETFTPILNPPQVAILGVGATALKPVEGPGGQVKFVPHLPLSLTINHMVVDGGPGARFLKALGETLANFELYLAL